MFKSVVALRAVGSGIEELSLNSRYSLPTEVKLGPFQTQTQRLFNQRSEM